VDVYRCLTLVYAFLLHLPEQDRFAHPVGGWAVLIAMAAWTGYLIVRRSRTTSRSNGGWTGRSGPVRGLSASEPGIPER
jgi:hypothetical protein